MTKVLIVLSAADKWTRADGSHLRIRRLGAGVRRPGRGVPEGRFPGGPRQPGRRRADDRQAKPRPQDGRRGDRCEDARLSRAERGAPRKPMVLAKVDASGYDAMVVPGGHGPVEDLYKDPDMGRLLIEADRDSKLIAAVCHGPAALAGGTRGERRMALRRPQDDVAHRRGGGRVRDGATTRPGCSRTRCANAARFSSRG